MALLMPTLSISLRCLRLAASRLTMSLLLNFILTPILRRAFLMAVMMRVFTLCSTPHSARCAMYSSAAMRFFSWVMSSDFCTPI